MGAFFIIPTPGRETSRRRRLQGTEKSRVYGAKGGKKKDRRRRDGCGEIGRGQRGEERDIE